MYKELANKARRRRISALQETRMPQVNLFWDGSTRAETGQSVIAHMTDLRVRMGQNRPALAPPEA